MLIIDRESQAVTCQKHARCGSPAAEIITQSTTCRQLGVMMSECPPQKLYLHGGNRGKKKINVQRPHHHFDISHREFKVRAIECRKDRRAGERNGQGTLLVIECAIACVSLSNFALQQASGSATRISNRRKAWQSMALQLLERDGKSDVTM